MYKYKYKCKVKVIPSLYWLVTVDVTITLFKSLKNYQHASTPHQKKKVLCPTMGKG